MGAGNWGSGYHVSILINILPVSHYSDVIMSPMASQIIDVSIVYSTVCFQAQIKENIKAPRHRSLWREFTGEFPTQRASNAENVSIWWRHHAQNLTDDQSTLVLLIWGNEPIDNLVECLWDVICEVSLRFEHSHGPSLYNIMLFPVYGSSLSLSFFLCACYAISTYFTHTFNKYLLLFEFEWSENYGSSRIKLCNQYFRGLCLMDVMAVHTRLDKLPFYMIIA